MSEEIVIRTVLRLDQDGKKLQQDVEKALNSPAAQAKAREAGRKWGEGINLGIETTRRSREDKELAHSRRMEAIATQSNARLVQIESRKQAQIDVIRERGVQKELEHARKIERELQRSAGAVGGLRSAVAGVAGAFGVLAGAGAITLFERVGRAALDAAISIDRQVSALTALTGSAAAAQRRFQELFRIAQATPGLTTGLAATLDAQLRVFNVNEQTINKLLPTIGRLNAITPLGDPKQFVNNLTQLISQNFERQDLKELVGQSPIAGQLIKQIFDVDNPTNAEAIRASARRLGVTSVERLAEELTRAGENNRALQNAVETLGGQFDKLQDRLNVALAPLGAQLANVLIPIFDDLVKETEIFGTRAAVAFRDSKNDIIALARELGNVAKQLGNIVNEVASLGAPGGFREIMRETALMLATLGDLTSGDFSGTRTKNLGLQFLRDDARAADAARVRAGVNSRFPSGVTIDDVTSFLSTPPPPRQDSDRGANLGGGGRSRALSERARQLVEARKNTAEALDVFMQGNIEDLEQVGRIINEANAAGEDRRRQIEARPAQLARFSVAQQERILAIEAEDRRLERNTREKAIKDQREALERLVPVLSVSERLMRGFESATISVGDAFERFGVNVAYAFGNVRNLFQGLKSAVLDFFNDLVGNTLQNLVRQTLGGIFGGGGILGNLFRTPSFAQAFSGGGITVPASITGSGGGSGATLSGSLGDFIGASVPRAAGSVASGGGFSLGGLFGGLAGAAPLLGLGLGSGFGGQSTAGRILGAVGGGAIGLGASFGAAVFGAGGGLAQAGLAALGPIGLIGVPLLIGASLLGKAKQRRQDEELSGQFLTQALQGIEQLAQAIGSGQITNLAEARGIFENNILGTFRQQISGLKTRSVVESRLTNQVRDLRNVFESRIPPLIAQAEAKLLTQSENAARFARQVPEFATGGTTRGGLALLHPGEKVLNLQQQSVVRAIAGPSVFERAGVPGPSANRVFDIGGTMPSGGGGTIEIHMGPPVVVISDKTAEGIYFAGAKTDKARGWTVKHVRDAQKEREL